MSAFAISNGLFNTPSYSLALQNTTYLCWGALKDHWTGLTTIFAMLVSKGTALSAHSRTTGAGYFKCQGQKLFFSLERSSEEHGEMYMYCITAMYCTGFFYFPLAHSLNIRQVFHIFGMCQLGFLWFISFGLLNYRNLQKHFWNIFGRNCRIQITLQ